MLYTHFLYDTSYVIFSNLYTHDMTKRGVSFYTKYGYKLTHINYNPSKSLCGFTHEIGHVLSSGKEKKNLSPHEDLRYEMVAWRLAKSFTKAIYWDELYAIKCLKSYADKYGIFFDTSRLKILPLYKGNYICK